MNLASRRKPSSALLLWLLVAGSAASACLLEDERCGPYQVEQHIDNVALCVCAPDAIPRDDGHACEPCGDHETPTGGECLCEEGFVRTTTDGPCEQSSIGAECTASEECSEAFPYCFIGSAMSTGGAGYCTTVGCEDNAGCPGSWTCEADGSERICKSLPSGLGDHCTTDDDCAGQQASFCERFQTNTCMLQDCATGTTRCPNEWSCCDYSGLLGVSLCLPPGQEAANECPSGGKLVTP